MPNQEERSGGCPLSVVVPAYNEETRLGAAIAAYLGALPAAAEVVIVDDGSTDATAEVARALARADARVRVLRLPENRGKGFAVRAGVLAARGDRVLMADADGSAARNMALSRERASSVAAALAAQGLPAPTFDLEGAGASGAVTPAGAPEPLRRRAEVVIRLGPDQTAERARGSRRR